jgi:hypothetical protein
MIYLKTTTGKGLGYGSAFINNVYKIQYSKDYTYISTNSIPAYSIGQWLNSSNNATGQNFTFKIPRSPTVPVNKTAVPFGHFGVWIDGVSMFNAWNNKSYNNSGVWQEVDYTMMKAFYDSCNGYPSYSNSEYHISVNPVCLYNISNSSHSPLLGFAFDGYPVYG